MAHRSLVNVSGNRTTSFWCDRFVAVSIRELAWLIIDRLQMTPTWLGCTCTARRGIGKRLSISKRSQRPPTHLARKPRIATAPVAPSLDSSRESDRPPSKFAELLRASCQHFTHSLPFRITASSKQERPSKRLGCGYFLATRKPRKIR